MFDVTIMNSVANMHELLTVLKLMFRENLNSIIPLAIRMSIVSTVRMREQEHEL